MSRRSEARSVERSVRNRDLGYTINDQLAVLPRLKKANDIAKLFGYAGTSGIKVARFRGQLIPSHRLHFAAMRFEQLALELREMARATPRARKVTKIRPELYADLGLVLGDAEAKPR